MAKSLAAKTGDTRDAGSIPGSGKCPEVGNSNLFQYSYLENSMDRGACGAAVHGVMMSWTWLSDQAHTYTSKVKASSSVQAMINPGYSISFPHSIGSQVNLVYSFSKLPFSEKSLFLRSNHHSPGWLQIRSDKAIVFLKAHQCGVLLSQGKLSRRGNALPDLAIVYFRSLFSTLNFSRYLHVLFTLGRMSWATKVKVKWRTRVLTVFSSW